MIVVRLPVELEAKLERIAAETHRTKSYYMRKALERFIEDRGDYLLAIARLEEKNDSISYAEIREDLGLDD